MCDIIKTSKAAAANLLKNEKFLFIVAAPGKVYLTSRENNNSNKAKAKMISKGREVLALEGGDEEGQKQPEEQEAESYAPSGSPTMSGDRHEDEEQAVESHTPLGPQARPLGEEQAALSMMMLSSSTHMGAFNKVIW